MPSPSPPPWTHFLSTFSEASAPAAAAATPRRRYGGGVQIGDVRDGGGGAPGSPSLSLSTSPLPPVRGVQSVERRVSLWRRDARRSAVGRRKPPRSSVWSLLLLRVMKYRWGVSQFGCDYCMVHKKTGKSLLRRRRMKRYFRVNDWQDVCYLLKCQISAV